MRTVSLALGVAVALAGGAYGHGWLDARRATHPAQAAFEAFYWKLQRHDFAAAGAFVEPESAADLSLVEKHVIGVPSDAGIARGFALDLRHDEDLDSAGRSEVAFRGLATVTVDPVGHLSAFGVPEVHEVEAQLVESGGVWRVVAFRDARVETAN